MRIRLYKEALEKLVFSILIFTLLVTLLYSAEVFLSLPSLLQWDNTAFCLGVAASVIGVAYILTIANPDNYTGFYGGIAMSILLTIQFILNRQFDLAGLYILVFIPVLIRSIVVWKKSNTKTAEPLRPTLLTHRERTITLLVTFGIIVGDYILNTRIIYADAYSDKIAIKLIGAILIASSAIANYWLIYKKLDAWVAWVIYAISGVVFYAILPTPNLFLVVLNIVFLIVNASALHAWIKIYRHV